MRAEPIVTSGDPWICSLLVLFCMWMLFVRATVSFAHRGDWSSPLLAGGVLFVALWVTKCFAAMPGS
jgi:hypothetical protein